MNVLRHGRLSSCYSSRWFFRLELIPISCTADITPTSSILAYPPFNEVIRWEGAKRVVLEQPDILESYILMPVFGLTTLDVFGRRLYVRIPYG